MPPGQNVPRTKCPLDKMPPEKLQDKMPPGHNAPQSHDRKLKNLCNTKTLECNNGYQMFEFTNM